MAFFMGIFVLSYSTLGLYAAALLMQALRLTGRLNSCKPGFMVFGIIAVALHGYLLHHWVDHASGQNLSLFNLLSMAVWLAAMLTLLIAFYKPIESLSIFIFPLAILSILLIQWFPGVYLVKTSTNFSKLLHILLSMLAFSVLCMAALQAILVAIQDYDLHHKKALNFIHKLPPLQTMEIILAQLTSAGLVLLTSVLITAIASYGNIFLPSMLEKSVLSICAWVIFAILVWGQRVWGWRGRIATYSTVVGVILLTIIYIGSRYLLLA